MTDETPASAAPANGGGVSAVLEDIRPRRRMRAGAGLAVGGISGAAMTTAIADLAIAWWPWTEALPVTADTEGAVRTLIVAAGTVGLGMLGGLGQAVATRFTRLGEE